MISTTVSRHVRDDVDQLLDVIRSTAGFVVPVTLIGKVSLRLLLQVPTEELALVSAGEVEDWLVDQAVKHHHLDVNETWLPLDSRDRDGGQVIVEVTPAQAERISELQRINPAVTPEVVLRAALRLWVGCEDTDGLNKTSVAEDLSELRTWADEDHTPIDWNDVDLFLRYWWINKARGRGETNG